MLSLSFSLCLPPCLSLGGGGGGEEDWFSGALETLKRGACYLQRWAAPMSDKRQKARWDNLARSPMSRRMKFSQEIRAPGSPLNLPPPGQAKLYNRRTMYLKHPLHKVMLMHSLAFFFLFLFFPPLWTCSNVKAHTASKQEEKVAVFSVYTC